MQPTENRNKSRDYVLVVALALDKKHVYINRDGAYTLSRFAGTRKVKLVDEVLKMAFGGDSSDPNFQIVKERLEQKEKESGDEGLRKLYQKAATLRKILTNKLKNE